MKFALYLGCTVQSRAREELGLELNQSLVDPVIERIGAV
jgi:hypothetical protein